MLAKFSRYTVVATLPFYCFVPNGTEQSSMLAKVVGRILLLVCCFESCVLMLGSRFYRIVPNNTL